MRLYEMMVIVNPEVEDTGVSDVVEKLSQLVKENGGDVEKVDEWGRRTMAYEIDHKKEGYYAVFYFQGDMDLPDKIRREIRLNPNILRGIILRREK